jgi:hypothetical protein
MDVWSLSSKEANYTRCSCLLKCPLEKGIFRDATKTYNKNKHLIEINPKGKILNEVFNV